MAFHDAFLEAYTRTKALQQDQQRLQLQKQLDAANIEHMQLTGKVLQAESKRKEHEMGIKDLEAQQAAYASGVTFGGGGGGAPAPSTGGNADESGAPLGRDPGPSAGAAGPAPTMPMPGPSGAPDASAGAGPSPGGGVDTVFGRAQFPGPNELATMAANRTRMTAEAGYETVDPAVAKALGMPGLAGKRLPPNTIGSMLQAKAATTAASIRASVTPYGYIQGLGGGGGGGFAPVGPSQAPAAPGATAPAPAGPAPAAPAPTPRDEAIAKVPTFFQPQVRGLLDYTADPSKISQRTPMGMIVINAVHKIDPTWNEDTYKQRHALRQSFTSGEESNNIKAVNTAAAHLGTVSEAADALNNGNIQLFNKLKNNFETAVGMPELNDYGLASHVTAQEVAKVVHGAGVVPEDQANKVDALAANVNSPAQLNGVFAMAAKLMEGRMAATTNKWTTGMGKPPDQPLFMPEALASLARLKQMGAGGGKSSPAADALKQKFGVNY